MNSRVCSIYEFKLPCGDRWKVEYRSQVIGVWDIAETIRDMQSYYRSGLADEFRCNDCLAWDYLGMILCRPWSIDGDGRLW
jgi:hypothetical protein